MSDLGAFLEGDEVILFFESVMTDSAEDLKRFHAVIINHPGKFQLVQRGLVPSSAMRVSRMLKALEEWVTEYNWFMGDAPRIVSLEAICNAAGTTVDLVREHYAEWLNVPFDASLVLKRLRRVHAGDQRRAGVQERNQSAPGARSERVEAGEGVAGQDSPSEEGKNSLH